MSKLLLVHFFLSSVIRYTNSNPVVRRILRFTVFGGSLKISKPNIVGLQYSACNK
jgi:hypothetical protein